MSKIAIFQRVNNFYNIKQLTMLIYVNVGKLSLYTFAFRFLICGSFWEILFCIKNTLFLQRNLRLTEGSWNNVEGVVFFLE